MSDYFKEIFIDKNPTRGEWFRGNILAAIFGGLGLSCIVGGFLLWTILFFFSIPCFILVWYWKSQARKTYEYEYVNGDMVVSVLAGNRKRKVLANLDQTKLESLRKGTDRHSYQKNQDVIDYTSNKDEVPFWEATYYGKKGVFIVLLELPDDVLQDMKRRNPKAVSLY